MKKIAVLDFTQVCVIVDEVPDDWTAEQAEDWIDEQFPHSTVEWMMGDIEIIDAQHSTSRTR